MIQSVTFSKPVKDSEAVLGRPYIRVKIHAGTSSAGERYFAEFFTEKQAFHEQMTAAELDSFIAQHAGKTFKNCIELTDTEEITLLANKKGKITELRRPRKNSGTLCSSDAAAGPDQNNRVKKYLLPEGIPVPFLVLLGIMTADGKVIASKYDKYRQINRFLEFIDDILPDIEQTVKAEEPDRPIRITDFGCGKSYLTFAVHYYLTEIKKLPVEIVGLDLKKDVITYCSELASNLHCTGLSFAVGTIAGYQCGHDPDLVITLHACDTATDYALDYAVKHHCTAVLSVPCCQHELNMQLGEDKTEPPEEFAPLLKYGLIRERFAALATDALRAEYLEEAGYAVQMIEFIDIEHTPKNILIRAVKKQQEKSSTAGAEADALTAALHVSPTLRGLLRG